MKIQIVYFYQNFINIRFLNNGRRIVIYCRKYNLIFHLLFLIWSTLLFYKCKRLFYHCTNILEETFTRVLSIRIMVFVLDAWFKSADSFHSASATFCQIVQFGCPNELFFLHTDNISIIVEKIKICWRKVLVITFKSFKYLICNSISVFSN